MNTKKILHSTSSYEEQQIIYAWKLDCYILLCNVQGRVKLKLSKKTGEEKWDLYNISCNKLMLNEIC